MAQTQNMSASLQSRYPWITTPFVVSAPMRYMAGPALAVAVSSAGGLGFIGPGMKPQDTAENLEKAVSLIHEPHASSKPSENILATRSHLPIGVGFLLWADDIEVAVAAIEKHKPCAAWLYGPSNGPKDFDEWSSRIRKASPETQIWIQIGTLKEAKQILQSSQKPDILVVQGAESGGHGRATDGMGLMSLLPEISDAMAGSGIPLLAAGGIADGRGVSAALCLGASGVVMGTRFLAASEARVAQGYQNEIVSASDGALSTTRTLLYNHLGGTYGWPKEYCPRVIINRSFVEEQEGKSFDELKKLYVEAAKSIDTGYGPQGRLATYAGASIGLIHDVKDAKDIIHEAQADHLTRTQTLSRSNI